MSEVTEGDRQKAWQVLCALPISIPGYSPETVRKAQDQLAAALAEERQKARVPFLALAESVWSDGTIADTDVEQRIYSRIATRIRRAAEVTA